MRTSNAVMMSIGLLLIGATSAISMTSNTLGGAADPPPPRTPNTPHSPHTTTTPVVSPQNTAATKFSGPLTASLMLRNGVLSPSAQNVLAMLQLRTGQTSDAVHVPAAVAIVLDVSGSMNGDKMRDAKKAAKGLLAQLSDGDRVSLVSFATDAITHLDNAVLGPDRTEIERIIDGIDVRDTTCISCGLDQGITALYKAPGNFTKRLILLSDGKANQGVQGVQGLANIVSNARNAGAVTSTIGLGAGYDVAIMRALAESGAGRYYFVHNATAIKPVLDAELVQMRTALVKDLTVNFTGVDGTRLGAVNMPHSWLASRSVSVGPMAAQTERRVLLPISLPANYSGNIVTARVTFTDVRGKHHDLSLQATISRSSDPAAVHASRNPLVIAHAARIRSLDVVERALQAKSEGRTAEALELLDDAAAVMGQVAADTGDEDAQAEAAELQVLKKKVQMFAPGSKQMRATSLLNSARKSEVLKGGSAGDAFHKNGMYNEEETQ